MTLFRTVRIPAALPILLVLCALSAPALAERADRDKPANVEADQLTADDLQQTNVFTGNVVLTKGTLIIRADKLTLKQDPEGYQYGTALANNGKLAFFRQKREGLDEYIEGVAERMEYDGKTEKIKLFTRAVMKRIAAEKDADEVRGNIIDYDSRTEFFTVLGGPDGATPGNPTGRVRAIIQPKNKPDVVAAPPAGGVKAAVPAPTPTPTSTATPAPASAAPARTPGVDLKAAPGLANPVAE